MNNKSLSLWSWRAALLVLYVMACAFGLWASSYWENATAAKAGTLAASFGAPDAQLRRPILEMAPDSPLARAGAKVNDLVRFDHKSVLGSLQQLGTDDTIGLTLRSGDHASHIAVHPMRDKFFLAHATAAQLAATLTIIIGFLAPLIGLLIGWRLGDSLPMRLFALLLILPMGADVFRAIAPVSAITDFYIQFINPLQASGQFLVFTLFTLLYPEDQPLWRHRWIRRSFYVLLAAFAVLYARDQIAALDLFPSLQSSGAFELVTLGAYILSCLTIAVSLISLGFSWRQASGNTRQRLGWISACMGSIYASWFLALVDQAFGWPVPLLTCFVCTYVVNLLALTGFAYALLRHRLFDFGFVVNRALVVTIISTLLLVLFSITEWGVDKLLHFEGREKNAFFDALVALGVILSFHRIQHWVSHKVDQTFFHHWYEAAGKLRHFLDKAAHISQPEALQDKFMQAILEFCGARGAAFYVLDAAGNYALQASTLDMAPAAIDANHDVAIDLRHGGKSVYVQDITQSLPGELALPMMVRGRLNGFLLLGQRARGDRFRPDQITLLSTAAHQYGLDMESLRVEAMERRASESERKAELLENEVNALRNHNQDLQSTNQGLFEALNGAKLSRVG